jgi:hypothetical protein
MAMTPAERALLVSALFEHSKEWLKAVATGRQVDAVMLQFEMEIALRIVREQHGQEEAGFVMAELQAKVDEFKARLRAGDGGVL